MGILQVTLDAPLITLGKLILEQRCEIAGGRPPLAIGTLGEVGPQLTDGGQMQRGQQHRQAGEIDGDRCGGLVGRQHGSTSTRRPGSSTS
jgi:hypothetical protein